jgi:serine/threonine protein kinase
LIMSPVAEYDLSYFLKQAQTSRDNISSLRTFFGCLATAVSYLYGKRIRHKDIKPSNILVNDGTVLLTDFGLSRDCNHTRSTTEGPTARTAKYCAPEVADDSPRSFSSDIWSLGCVYLEMITVLKGYSLDDMRTYFECNGTKTTTFWRNTGAVTGWMTQLSTCQTLEPDNAPFEWIEQMLRYDRLLRPLASVLVTEITHHRSHSDRIGEFCGICCRIEDESFSDSSNALTPSTNSLDMFVKPSIEDLSDLRMDSPSNIIPNEMHRKHLILKPIGMHQTHLL